MSKPSDYRILRSEDPKRLEKYVNDAKREGYEPVGRVAVREGSLFGLLRPTLYHQAVEKKRR